MIKIIDPILPSPSAGQQGATAFVSELLDGAPKIPANVAHFPSHVLRPQDIILAALKRGEVISDIAQITGLSEDQVTKFARSDWMENELREWVRTQPPDSTHTIKALMKNQAFEAVLTIGKLMKCGIKNVELGACKLALEYTLAPAKERQLDKPKGALPSSEAEMIREMSELDKSISTAQKRAII